MRPHSFCGTAGASQGSRVLAPQERRLKMALGRRVRYPNAHTSRLGPIVGLALDAVALAGLALAALPLHLALIAFSLSCKSSISSSRPESGTDSHHMWATGILVLRLGPHRALRHHQVGVMDTELAFLNSKDLVPALALVVVQVALRPQSLRDW